MGRALWQPMMGPKGRISLAVLSSWHGLLLLRTFQVWGLRWVTKGLLSAKTARATCQDMSSALRCTSEQKGLYRIRKKMYDGDLNWMETDWLKASLLSIVRKRWSLSWLNHWRNSVYATREKSAVRLSNEILIKNYKNYNNYTNKTHRLIVHNRAARLIIKRDL